MRSVPRLREFRERAVLSQKDLARLAHIAESTIWRIEGGYPARQSTIRRLAAALDVKPADLMEPGQ